MKLQLVPAVARKLRKCAMCYNSEMTDCGTLSFHCPGNNPFTSLSYSAMVVLTGPNQATGALVRCGGISIFGLLFSRRAPREKRALRLSPSVERRSFCSKVND
jgi:hypothetical protein